MNIQRISIIILVIALVLSLASNVYGNGKSKEPLPPHVTLPPQATRNPHYPTSTPVSPIGELDVPPPCGYLDEVPCDLFRPEEQDELSAPTRVPSPGATQIPVTRVFPDNPRPTATAPIPSLPAPDSSHDSPTLNVGYSCLPPSDLGPDEIGLLIEAVYEGYQVIIVEDVMATSPSVVIIGNK